MKKAILLMISTTIAGCSSQLSYQQKLNSPYGYEDSMLSDGVYYIKYSAFAMWASSDGKKHWHRRAKELCNDEIYTEINYLEYYETIGGSMGYSVVGGTPYFYPETTSAAVSEGFIHCSNSQISIEQAKTIAQNSNHCPSCKTEF